MTAKKRVRRTKEQIEAERLNEKLSHGNITATKEITVLREYEGSPAYVTLKVPSEIDGETIPENVTIEGEFEVVSVDRNVDRDTGGKIPMKGLGDVVEKITEVTGIKALVKFIAGEDCGCEERKQKLNELFPFNKPNCLLEGEYEYLKDLFKEHLFQLTMSQQLKLLAIYQRVFNEKRTATTCPDCWRDILNKLKSVYESYEDGKSTQEAN